jgi:DNA-binding NarL/FixJ family response regulator
VVCSAKKDAEDMERARQLGASGYVVKPFDIDRLIDAVLEATGRSRTLQPGRASELGIERPELA